MLKHIKAHKIKRRCSVDGTSSRPFQLYVQANDGLWYLQRQPMFRSRRKHWSVDCCFGDANTPTGASFTLVAVFTDKRPHSPLEFLPDGEISEPVVVRLTD